MQNRNGKKIAVVGSGPAGLACAAELNCAGHTVHVFERDDAIGGILRYGIPDFKLEKHILDRRITLLKKEGIAVSIFSGVQPDPSDKNVLEGLRQFQESKADIIVGLGGGSSMDTAKVISILTNNELPMSQYAGYHKIPNPGVACIVIPTTAGTGSEVTKVAVIGDTERDVKMMMLDVNLLPTVALVDPQKVVTDGTSPLVRAH